MSVRRIAPDLHADAGDFYRQVVGLETQMDLGWVEILAAPDNPSAQVILIREDASAPVRPDLSVEVDDVDAAYAEARRLGYEIVHPLTDEPWGVRRFFARDSGGNVVNVLSHR